MRPRRSPARFARPVLASVAATAVVAGGLLAAPIAASAADADASAGAAVTGVLFDWGINNESNGGAYFGGCNFLSAGLAGDTGSSRLWSAADGFYSSSEGDVTIVKPTADGSGLTEPTWATKCQTPSGASVAGRVTSADTSYTQSRVQIENGTGTVDVAANTARIEWDGDFTVAYYGGMTYWSASDPVLTVDADGTGTVTATASGFGTDMDDPSIWEAIAPAEITLATLSNVDVTADGFTVLPDYLGVSIPDDVAGRNPQAVKTAENESWWGSFPADYLRFQELTGQTSYWFTTAGGATSIQPRKATLPLTVEYTAVVPAPPVISRQPTAQNATTGSTATFSVTATDASAYQWQSGSAGTWTDIAGATSARYTVTASSAAGAKSYRVVVSNADGSVTSNAVALNVTVPIPTVTVSKTEGLDPAGETVTVRGTGFLPNDPATTASRVIAGEFAGAYIAFGKFADEWKATEGAPSSARAADRENTLWGVHADELAAIGGPSAGAVEIAADGTFEVTLTASKDFAGAPETGNYGVYTYAAGGTRYAPFEIATPVAFAVLAPSAPAAPSATLNGTDAIDVAWTAPADNGEAITGYDVTLTPSTGAAAITRSVGADRLTASFTGLTPGVGYTAAVVAKNAGGSSPSSPASELVSIPAVAPSAPTDLTVAPGTTAATFSWTPGFHGGDSDVTYTLVVRDAADAVVAETATGATTARVEGLVPGAAYSASVTARTLAGGFSPASDVVSFSALATVPGALAAPRVTATSNTTINVVWAEAEETGGSPVTSYLVTVYAGDTVATTATVDASRSYALVRGLTEGATYTATVTAVNAAGSGAESPRSAAVTTLTVPDAPASVAAALAGSDAVTVTWAAPAATGGSKLTGYQVILLANGEAVDGALPGVAATETTFEGLEPGAVYSAEVYANNVIGQSAAAVTNEVTVPAVAPSAPAAPALTAPAAGGAIVATWAAPSSTGGSAVTGYTLTLTDADGAVTTTAVAGDVLTATVSGLAAGEYTATVTVTTIAGSATSPASAAVTVAEPAPVDPEPTPEPTPPVDPTPTPTPSPTEPPVAPTPTPSPTELAPSPTDPSASPAPNGSDKGGNGGLASTGADAFGPLLAALLLLAAGAGVLVARRRPVAK